MLDVTVQILDFELQVVVTAAAMLRSLHFANRMFFPASVVTHTIADRIVSSANLVACLQFHLREILVLSSSKKLRRKHKHSDTKSLRRQRRVAQFSNLSWYTDCPEWGFWSWLYAVYVASLRETREWRRLRNEELYVLYSPNIRGEQIKKSDMDRACSTYGGEERCIQGFGGEAWRTETTWKTQA